MSNRKIWDFWANHYEKLWVQKVSLRPTRTKVINELKHLIIDKNKTYRILDIGCGTGQLIRDIFENFKEYKLQIKGIDFSEEMIRTSFKNTNFVEIENRIDCKIEFEKMDVNDIDILGKTYDIITCTHSLPYYKEQKQIIQKMKKIIDPNGAIILSQASVNTLYDKLIMHLVKMTTGHATYPSKEEMISMVDGDFRVTDYFKIKNKFFMPSIYLFILRQVMR